jgi:hypothetical protein
MQPKLCEVKTPHKLCQEGLLFLHHQIKQIRIFFLPCATGSIMQIMLGLHTDSEETIKIAQSVIQADNLRIHRSFKLLMRQGLAEAGLGVPQSRQQEDTPVDSIRIVAAVILVLQKHSGVAWVGSRSE